MSRKPKKRNKPYTGEDAAKPPTVRRYQAVVRSPMGEWWHDHKRMVRMSAIVGGVVLLIAFLVYGVVDLIF